MSATDLKRTLNLPVLVFYGLGTMVGGGFYALLGKVGAEAGTAMPLALVLAGVLAGVSGLSFAELSSRFPVSAGEVEYVRAGFGRRKLAVLVGWLVILTGVVSSATLSVATIGFLTDLVDLPHALGVVLLVAAMAGVAAWGVGQSALVVTAITVVEVGALVYAGWAARAGFAELPARAGELVPGADAAAWIGVGSGAFLAFYAFVGFEDLVNMAEEVKDVKRTLPRAIVISVVITTLLYLVVGSAAVLHVPVERLAASSTPIAELVDGDGWYATTGIGLVSVLAGVNGALVQIVMAARVAYGMAQREQAPGWLGEVHPATRTPLRGTVVVGLVVLGLALFVPLTALAKSTSAVILVVFTLVNVALLRIRRYDPDPDGEGPRFAAWVPATGAVACVSLLAFQAWRLASG